MVYINPSPNNLGADSKIYYKTENVQLELYTRKRELKICKEVERILSDNYIYYEKYETYIDNEKLYQTVYLFEIEGGL